MDEREAPGASDFDHGSDLAQALSRCRSSLEHRLSVLGDDRQAASALEVLRGDVSDLASRCRRLDVPPERLLVSLKKMVRDAAAFPGWGVTERDAVMHELVLMTIEAYYSQGHDRH